MDPTLVMTGGLAAVGLLAGFIDAIAGGGALLTLPALLLAGLDPLSALATNKVQGSLGSGSATIAYARRGLIDGRGSIGLVVATVIGTAIGFSAISIAPMALLSAMLPVLLIVMAVYFALSPKLSDRDAKARLSKAGFAGVAMAIGFYDGIFGPGTGSFFMLGFVLLLGYGVVRATAHTKLLNFASNLAAVALFAWSGHVEWAIGLAMGAGQFLGAQVGSHLAVRHGARLVRPLLVLVCCGMAVRLMLDSTNPLNAALRSLFN